MLEIRQRRVNNIIVLELTGSIDIDSSNFIEKIGMFVCDGYLDILCNLESVTVVDYSGLSVLAVAYKNVLNHKGRIKFCCLPLHINKTFHAVGLDKVFQIYPDEKAALKEFEEEAAISKIKKIQLRRRFKRLDLDQTMQFKSKAESKFNSGKVLNISGIGLLVFTDNIYPIGEILDVEIPLSPVVDVIHTQCKVAWIVEKELQPQIYPGMGLEFYHIDPQLQQKVLDFVERNLPSDALG